MNLILTNSFKNTQKSSVETLIIFFNLCQKTGGGQNLERPNLEDRYFGIS